MVDPNALLSLVVAAAAKAALGRVVGGACDALLSAIDEVAVSRGFRLDDSDRGALTRLIEYRPGLLQRAVANIHLTNRRGIALIGPSGAGKTALRHVLRGMPVMRGRSTTEVEHSHATLGPRVHRILDGAGRAAHGVDVALAAIRKHPPDVLCVVMANAFLETENDRELSRGESRFDKLDEYLRYTAREESDWIDRAVSSLTSSPSRKPLTRVDHVIFVINKADLWASDGERHRYATDPEFSDRLATLTAAVAGPGRTPTEIVVAAKFGSFQNGRRQPVAGYSDRASEASAALFRAYVAGLLTLFR